MTYGAHIIARSLHDLGVQVIFGLPGLPVIDIAQEAINLGIRFISCRNEQASVYAASCYGYLTGKPGVCISVGGPGVLHVMAGIPHAAANSWPLLILGGSSETHNAGKGAFQEMDAIPMLSNLNAKSVTRPPLPEMIPAFIRDAYRLAMYGRPGPCFVDLPANLILGHFDIPRSKLQPVTEVPKAVAPVGKIQDVVSAFKSAKAPLIVLGKGAAYGRAEKQIQTLVERTGIPFVPSPMAKGIVPDSSPHNASSARSTALKTADVVLVLGARLNWVLGFGLPPKWNPNATVIQVDILADELGKNGGHPTLSLVGDVALITEQLIAEFGSWKLNSSSSSFLKNLAASKSKNEDRAAKKLASNTKLPMSFEKAYDVIKKTFNSITPPGKGDIIYVSEGANAMDISRSAFPLEHPRSRLDAGTYATMGVGMGYALAAYAAYNFPSREGASGSSNRKKIVAIEGDSAFGFSAMEVDTMARFGMDVLIFVMNNSGLYNGDANDSATWKERQRRTLSGDTTLGPGNETKQGKQSNKGASLSAMSLGYETDYQKIAEMAGGVGLVARTPEELAECTRKGFEATVPVVVNVIVDPQADLEIDFSWLDMAPPKKDSKL